MIIEQIKAQAKNDNKIEVVWLYGSQAKGNAHANSDIDIAIAFKNFDLNEFDKKLRPEEYALLWSNALNIEEHKLSIVDINTIPMYLAFNVIEYGQVIYSRNKVREMKETQRIYSQFEFETIEHNIKFDQ